MGSLRHLNKYLLKYRFRLLAGVFFIIVSNLFAIYPAQLTRHAIDYATNITGPVRIYNDYFLPATTFSHYTKVFLFYLALIIAAVLLKGIFMFFMRQTIIVTSRLIEFDLKNEIFHHYMKLDVGFFKRNNTGDLMARISEDVSQVRMYLGPAIMYTTNLLIMIMVTVSAMFTVNVKLSLFALLPIPLMGYLVFKVSQVINDKSERVQNQVSSIATYVQETISGIRVIKSFARESSVSSRFEMETAEFRKRSLNLAKTDAMFNPFILLLIGVSTLLTLLVGAYEVKAGRISLGNIAEFILYINMLTWPVASVGWVTSLVQKAAASQTRINEFLKTEPEINKSSGKSVAEVKGKIEFKNVSFSYKDSGIHALKNISFTIEAGSSLGIIGKTGSGKSTIASLMVRLYDPDSGQVMIDDFDIKGLNITDLRDHISYVPQDVFLFSDTIGNNIAFGIKSGNSDKVKIEKAAKQAVIYDSILEFPDQFDTMVGERGITLSGGQKQRISIARALAKDSGVLIFDDCLSAVDTSTEDKILRNLKQEMKGRTSVVISHRVSSVMQADKIIVIDQGEITETGSHEQLLNNKGFYYQLYQSQLSAEH